MDLIGWVISILVRIFEFLEFSEGLLVGVWGRTFYDHAVIKAATARKLVTGLIIKR
jgi:hypothetical protein